MAPVKTVGIKELKNNLSAYLREVRQGTRVLVSDRATVVAELHEPGARYAADEGFDPILAEWADKGAVRLPAAGRRKLQPSPIRSRAGTAADLLREDRAETHG
jgi:antitoxin (DNA-binding transcriptional repressor) of toxin-antitoxin stability system